MESMAWSFDGIIQWIVTFLKDVLGVGRDDVLLNGRAWLDVLSEDVLPWAGFALTLNLIVLSCAIESFCLRLLWLRWLSLLLLGPWRHDAMAEVLRFFFNWDPQGLTIKSDFQIYGDLLVLRSVVCLRVLIACVTTTFVLAITTTSDGHPRRLLRTLWPSLEIAGALDWSLFLHFVIYGWWKGSLSEHRICLLSVILFSLPHNVAHR